MAPSYNHHLAILVQILLIEWAQHTQDPHLLKGGSAKAITIYIDKVVKLLLSLVRLFKELCP